MRKIFSPEQKAKIVLEALHEIKTINQIASEYEVHPNVVGVWRKTAKENIHLLFADKRTREEKTRDYEKEIDELHRIIGKRDTELEWLKKKLHLNI